jgi:putative nucleotidyltransferase with HDIG domain
MIRTDQEFFKTWFNEHTGSFSLSNKTDKKNFSLKIQHSLCVCENTSRLAEDLGLSRNERMIAETAALFHDIGRFSQYAQNKTFKDSISKNHGRLGAQVLMQKKILGGLPETEQEIIINTVKYHSAFSVPETLGHEKKFYLKLIRDADKLDIWRVFVDYYNMSKSERTAAVAQELPDTPGYSEEVLSCISDRRMAKLSTLKTLNDFKLTQLSWIYDLNFSSSFRLLLERGYLAKIISKLPQTENIRQVSRMLHEFAMNKSGQADETLRQQRQETG